MKTYVKHTLWPYRINSKNLYFFSENSDFGSLGTDLETLNPLIPKTSLGAPLSFDKVELGPRDVCGVCAVGLELWIQEFRV